VNRHRFVHPVPPIGALYIASALRQRGHEVRLIDFMFAGEAEETITATLAKFHPDVVGISLRNVDALISKNEFCLPELRSCVQCIQRLSPAPIVLGGPGFSLFAGDILSALNLDIGVAGEADETFPELVERLANGRPFGDIGGLCYRTPEGLVSTPVCQVGDLDAIPFQAIDLIDAKRYDRARGAMGVFTRKACPLRCTYCPEETFHGSRVRLRSAKRVVDEMEYIIDTAGVRYFDFADTAFNAPRSHAMAVCQEIVDRKVDLQFEVELNPVDQNRESVRLLKAAGCQGVDLTIDSGSNRMLRSLRKGFTSGQALDAARLYAEFAIPYTAEA
jgi:radical SAM superfamily enzyme YgiQ (UPF0313 family)